MPTTPVPSAPSHRDDPEAVGASPTRVRTQGGFTLLELLMVIAILGVLAGVAVFAVGAVRENSQEVACDTDARVIATAQGAHSIDAGRPGSEAELVASGYLADESQYHDVLVGADSYDLVAVGGCASAEEPTSLRTGMRIGDAPADGSELEPAPVRSRTPVRSPAPLLCGMLGPDTGDANQNPAPCDDRRLRRNLTRVDPGETTPLKPTTGDTSCAPNRICDTDMAPETRPGR